MVTKVLVAGSVAAAAGFSALAAWAQPGRREDRAGGRRPIAVRAEQPDHDRAPCGHGAGADAARKR